MDLNKADMLQLLSYLEGELQARDVVIATLKVSAVSLSLPLWKSWTYQLSYTLAHLHAIFGQEIKLQNLWCLVLETKMELSRSVIVNLSPWQALKSWWKYTI